MRRILLRAAVAATLLAGTACSVDKVSAPVPEIAETVFAPDLNVNLAAMTVTNSGLYIQDLVAGTGAAVAVGQVITVHYTGWLANGTRFDGNVGGTPLTREIGVGGLIRGWDEGLIGMKVGGKRRLIVPPALGYANNPRPGIPANSILVFDVQLVGVE
jgi:peptidylprolyl isomerase